MTESSSEPAQALLEQIASTIIDQILLLGGSAQASGDAALRRRIEDVKAAYAGFLQDISGKIWMLEHPSIDQAAVLSSRRNQMPEAATMHGFFAELELNQRALRSAVQAGIGDERLAPHLRNYLTTLLSRLMTQTDELERIRLCGPADSAAHKAEPGNAG